jgi:hypothetical protein
MYPKKTESLGFSNYSYYPMFVQSAKMIIAEEDESLKFSNYAVYLMFVQSAKMIIPEKDT